MNSGKMPALRSGTDGSQSISFSLSFSFLLFSLCPLICGPDFVIPYVASDLGKLPFPLAIRLVFNSVFLLIFYNVFIYFYID